MSSENIEQRDVKHIAEQLLNGIHAVMKKSATDADFRKKALADATAAIREADDCEIPSKARIRFVEDTDELIIKLPPFQGTEAEISEEKMAAISGGHMYWTHLNVLVTPHGEPIYDYTAGGKPYKAEPPGYIKDASQKFVSWVKGLF